MMNSMDTQDRRDDRELSFIRCLCDMTTRYCIDFYKFNS